MDNIADISELDDRASTLRVQWNKLINYASTYTKEFLALREVFESGRYGPEWTFSRWLIVKCGLSERTSYRVIAVLNHAAEDDAKAKSRQLTARLRQEKVDKKAAAIASQIAWNEWRAEEKARIAAEKLAEKIRKQEDRERIKAERERRKTERAEARKKEEARKRARAYRKRKRDEKREKTKENNLLEIVTPNSGENEKPLPNVAEEIAIAVNDSVAEPAISDWRLAFIDAITRVFEKIPEGHYVEAIDLLCGHLAAMRASRQVREIAA